MAIETPLTAVTTVTPDIVTATAGVTTALAGDSAAMTDVPEAAAALADGSTATTDIRPCEWSGYPQFLFGNWTSDQVERSQMFIKCPDNQHSTIYWMDVLNDGEFTTPDMTRNGHTSTETSTNFWKMLKEEVSNIHDPSLCASFDVRHDLQRPGHIRVRSLFVDHLSAPVLRVLGTTYGVSFVHLLALKALYSDTTLNHFSSRHP